LEICWLATGLAKKLTDDFELGDANQDTDEEK